MSKPLMGSLPRDAKFFIALSGILVASQQVIAPVYAIFVLSRGLSYGQFAIVDSIFLITILTTDYLTGGFADRYGRRAAVVLAYALWGAGLLIYSVSNTFAYFAIGEIVSGLGMSFLSGSLYGWAYDSLVSKGFENEASHVFGLAGTIGSGLGVVGPVLSGFYGQIDLRFPFLFAGALGLVGSAVSFFVIKENRAPKSPSSASYSWIMRQAWRELTGSRSLLLLTLSLALFSLAYPFGNLLWQPRLVQLGSSVILLGVVTALMSIGASVASYLSGRAGRGGNLVRPALVGMGTTAVALFLASYANFLVGLTAALILFRAGVSGTRPATTTWTNQMIRADTRATTLSLQSTLTNIASVAGTLAVGVAANTSGLPIVFALGGVFCALGIIPIISLTARMPANR